MTKREGQSAAVIRAAVLTMAGALFVLPGVAAAQNAVCLPVSPAGSGTSFGYGGNMGRGSFTGVTVTELRVPGIAATISNRAGTVFYSGPLTVGQVIPLPISWNIVWNGTGARNHGNAACLRANY